LAERASFRCPYHGRGAGPRRHAYHLTGKEDAAWAAIAACNLVAIPAIVIFVLSGGTKVLIACAAVAIIAGQLEILAKLWYWVVHGRIVL